MTYLTASHTAPPAHVTYGDRLVPTAPLIARNDTARLAELGIYPHETAEGSAPLGYTDWVLIDGAYHREPTGTPEERQAAMTQPEPTIEDRRAAMSCTDLQAMLAISRLGMVSAYDAWLADPERTFEEKQFALRAKTWERMNPFVLAVQDWMQMTDEQVDDFFALAVTL